MNKRQVNSFLFRSNGNNILTPCQIFIYVTCTMFVIAFYWARAFALAHLKFIFSLTHLLYSNTIEIIWFMTAQLSHDDKMVHTISLSIVQNITFFPHWIQKLMENLDHFWKLLKAFLFLPFYNNKAPTFRPTLRYRFKKKKS